MEIVRRKDSSRVLQPLQSRRSIAWFCTMQNIIAGYSVYRLEQWEDEWLKSIDVDTSNVYRLHTSSNGGYLAIAKIDLAKGNIRFMDNNYLTETDRAKFHRPQKFIRFIIEEGVSEFDEAYIQIK